MPSHLRSMHVHEDAADGGVLTAVRPVHWWCDDCGTENREHGPCRFCGRLDGWLCEACRHRNPDGAKQCETCGRPREDGCKK